LVVDMSSVTPVDSGTCAERLKEYDVLFLDAPVSNDESKAGILKMTMPDIVQCFENFADVEVKCLEN